MILDDAVLLSEFNKLWRNGSLVGEKFFAYNNSGNKKEWTILKLFVEYDSIEHTTKLTFYAIDLKNSLSAQEGRKLAFELIGHNTNKDFKTLFFDSFGKLSLCKLDYFPDSKTLSFRHLYSKDSSIKYTIPKKWEDIFSDKAMLIEFEINKLLIKNIGPSYYDFYLKQFWTRFNRRVDNKFSSIKKVDRILRKIFKEALQQYSSEHEDEIPPQSYG